MHMTQSIAMYWLRMRFMVQCLGILDLAAVSAISDTLCCLFNT